VLNPILSGGGVKTKAIDALARNANLVSTETGAIGIERKLCGDKLTVIPDNELDAFVRAIIKCSETATNNIPKQFYEIYNWSKIIERMEL
jgi:hypothetical protein